MPGFARVLGDVKDTWKKRETVGQMTLTSLFIIILFIFIFIIIILFILLLLLKGEPGQNLLRQVRRAAQFLSGTRHCSQWDSVGCQPKPSLTELLHKAGRLL